MNALPDQTARYVVLHHLWIQEPHFDFMLELQPASPLKTWRLPCWPVGRFNKEATALDDHRNSFLEYEGPLSKGRGTVQRVEGGTCVIEKKTEVSYTLRLSSGQQLWLVRNVGRGQDSKARRAWVACSFPSDRGA